jgi:hypothetical protein
MAGMGDRCGVSGEDPIDPFVGREKGMVAVRGLVWG